MFLVRRNGNNIFIWIWNNPTIERSQCVTSIRFTIHIVMVSYQYKSSLCYRDVDLLRFISCYFTLIYNKYAILLCFIGNHHKNLLISQIIIAKICLSCRFRINSFVTFSNNFFLADNYIYHLPKTLIALTQQTLKDAHIEQSLKDKALSGVIRLL